MHPLRGALSPHEFLPIADRLVLTTSVDALILKRAPEDLAHWDTIGLGIEVELDDFGTGKASTLGIIEMAPTRIKVAREITAPLPDGEEGLSFVHVIAAIGHSLGVEMIAEGVEEKLHCMTTAELGFSRLQGSYFSHPLARDDLETWLAQHEQTFAGQFRKTG